MGNDLNEDKIFEIFALFYEETRDPVCGGCFDYQNQHRPDKRTLCNKYRGIMLDYLKTQGIEKK